jgi:hypothetical protein
MNDRHCEAGIALLHNLALSTRFSNIGMQFFRLASGLSSPAILMVVVWCGVLFAVATGPIDYPMQPSPTVLALVATAIFLFVVAHRAGAWCFDIWFKRQTSVPAPSIRTLSGVIIVTSLAGIAGIGLMAFDRLVLSDVSNSGYAELLRCAPQLVDIVEIKRTPLLYVGYVFFSFGFASLLLFLLNGDQVRGWPAALAQLSIISPVGYAVLYSGRMPILFVILLIASAMLVRLRKGERLLPNNHHLVLKTAVMLLAFAVYSTAMWSTRRSFCVQMGPVVRELEHRMEQRDLDRAALVPSKQDTLSRQPDSTQRPQTPPAASGPTDQGARVVNAPTPPPVLSARKEPVRIGQSPSSHTVSVAELNKMVDEARKSPPAAAEPASVATASSAERRGLLAMLEESWHVKPRGYVVTAMDSGLLSPPAALSMLGTYFYLTHGTRILHMIWQAREQFSPQWGVYEVGVLSPILRVFFPEDQRLAEMDAQLKSAKIHGFFPTAWGAAYIDFGASGAIIYILIWGFASGWSAFGVRHLAFVTPSLLLVFCLASIALSPVQGPLGIANSALVLFSMIVTGLAIDIASLRQKSLQEAGKMKLVAGSPSAAGR